MRLEEGDGVLLFTNQAIEECRIYEQELEAWGVDFRSYDVDQNWELAESYGIKTVPTLILFKDWEQIDRLVGFKEQDRIFELLKYVYNYSE